MTRRLSPIALLEKSVEDGQGEKFWALPGKIPGNREKKKDGEGSWGSLSFLSLCTLGSKGERA